MVDIHHQRGHLGTKRTLYFARLVDPQVSKETANSAFCTFQSLNKKKKTKMATHGRFFICLSPVK